MPCSEERAQLLGHRAIDHTSAGFVVLDRDGSDDTAPWWCEHQGQAWASWEQAAAERDQMLANPDNEGIDVVVARLVIDNQRGLA